MAHYTLISADSHMCEPPDMWAERIDKQYRDRAPHSIHGHEGKQGEFFTCENITPIPTREFIDEAFRDMPEGDIQKVVGGNVARIYSLNV